MEDIAGARFAAQAESARSLGGQGGAPWRPGGKLETSDLLGVVR